jgi:hypothetical protein
MSVINTIYRNLEKSGSLGVSVDTLVSRAKTSKANVYRRIYDLKNEGLDILTTTIMVKGKKKTYYRFS